MITKISRICAKQHYLVMGLWLVLAVGTFVAATIIKPVWIGTVNLPQSESTKAMNLLQEEIPNAQLEGTFWQGNIVFHSEDGIAAHRDEIEKFLNKLEKEDKSVTNIVSLRSPLELENASLISSDGTTAYAVVDFRTDRPYQDAGNFVMNSADEIRESLTVEFSGFVFDSLTAPHNEIYGLIIALLILFVTLGALVAAGLPIFSALCGVAVGVSLVELLSNIIEIPEASYHIGAMLGIGVGIDYSLFILTRYQKAIREGKNNREAIDEAMSTAGVAVFSAGITVVISILGILLINLNYLNGIAIGASLSIVVMMLMSMTLVPAILGSPIHKHLNKVPLPKFIKRKNETKDGWIRWGSFIQKNAVLGMVAGTVILLVISLPIFWMQIGVTDVGNESPDRTTTKAYNLMADAFGPGHNGPLVIVVDRENNKDRKALINLMRDIEQLDNVDYIYPNPELINAGLTINEIVEGIAEKNEGEKVDPSKLPDSILSGRVIPFVLYPTTAPPDQETTDLVHQIRNEIVPEHRGNTEINAYVTGITAGNIDFAEVMKQRIPIFIAAVLLISFLFLLFTFKSVLVALKAIIMNLLSIGAAYGVVIMVFQWGWFSSLLGVGKPGPIEPWAPMLLFAILFGLSMDYEVFLLSKIREEYEETKDNSKAVLNGLASTARVITAAALIMACVFGSFALSDQRPIKLMGLGLAVAVLLDATVVRMLLVPATMELLGNKNWWCPKWILRLMPAKKAIDTE